MIGIAWIKGFLIDCSTRKRVLSIHVSDGEILQLYKTIIKPKDIEIKIPKKKFAKYNVFVYLENEELKAKLHGFSKFFNTVHLFLYAIEVTIYNNKISDYKVVDHRSRML